MQIRSILVALLAVSIFFSGFNGLRIFTGVSLGDAFLVVLAFFWLITFCFLLHKKPYWYIVTSFFLFTLAYLITFFTIGLSSPEVETSTIEYVKFTIAFFVFTYLIFDLIKTRENVYVIMFAYVLSALVNSIVGIIDLSGFTSIASAVGIQTVMGYDYTIGGRAHGLTAHPNHLGYHAVIAIILMYGCARIGILRNSWLYWLFLVTLFVGVLASGSRASLLVILLVGLWIVWTNRIWVQKPINIFIAAVIIAALFSVAHQKNTQILGGMTRLILPGEGESISNNERIVKYLVAWNDFTQNPISGVGFQYINDAHNIYLQILQSSGLIGFFGLFFYFVFLVVKAFRIRFKYRNDNILDSVVAAVVALFLMGLFQNITYARFAVVPIGLLWVIMEPRFILLGKPIYKQPIRSKLV